MNQASPDMKLYARQLAAALKAALAPLGPRQVSKAILALEPAITGPMVCLDLEPS